MFFKINFENLKTFQQNTPPYTPIVIESHDPIQIGPGFNLSLTTLKNLEIFFNESTETFWKKDTLHEINGQKFTFTHDVLKRFRKKDKPKGNRYEFINTEKPLGHGCFGSVYPIISTLVTLKNEGIFKNQGTKSSKKTHKPKSRVVKFGTLGLFECTPSQATSHLGLKSVVQGKIPLNYQKFGLSWRSDLNNLHALNHSLLRTTYILVEDHLYHLMPDSTAEEVTITDWVLFKKKLAELRGNDVCNYLSLSLDDMINLIYANGGHLPSTACLVMNKIPGLPLATIEHLLNTVEKKIEFTEQLLQAMETQLEHLSHHDLHSGNIMVDLNHKPMSVNFIDYGLARPGNLSENIPAIKMILSSVWSLTRMKKLDPHQEKIYPFLLEKDSKKFTLKAFKEIDFPKALNALMPFQK